MLFLSNIKIDNNAKIIETDDFINVTFSENTVLNHFWKIHISMKFEDSEAVITTVANYLNKKHINYKFVKSTGLVKKWLSIRTHESQIGKIITIYPTSIAQTDLLLKQLSKILRNYSGPNIFTDRAYKDSQNVFYRYGYHIATSDDHIIGPNQEIFYDDRRPYFQSPSWIKDPFCSENNVNGQVVQNKYKVIGAIDRRPGGNVYLASSYRDGKKYIIKEARKYVFAGDNKLKSVLKNNEFNNIKDLNKKSLLNKDYQKTRQFILTEINKNVLSEKKSNVIGITKPYFINNNYVSRKKEDIIEILNNYEVKNGEKTFLKQNPNPNSVISPYLIDGAAGAILVSLLNSVEIENIKQYLEILNYPLAKTPGFLDGLAGIAFVNIELFLHTHNNKYLQIATTQVLNCMNYTIIENSSVLFYSFYSAHNSENFFNGTEGIYAMAQYLYEINESRLAKNDKKILA